MVMDIIQISPAFLGLVPVVIAITQWVKSSEFIPSRFVPLVAVVIGIVGASLTSGGFSLDTGVQGFLVGLSAVGLFSGTRTAVNG